MNDQMKKRIEDARDWENVKELCTIIEEIEAERERERAAWSAVVFGAMGYAADLSEVQRTNGGRLRMHESKESFKKRLDRLVAFGVNVDAIRKCVAR